MNRPFWLVALVVCTACANDPASPPPVSANLSVRNSTLMYGDTLRLDLTFTNNTDADITYQANTCNRHFEVLDRFGRVVGPTERVACTESIVIGTIRPGATAQVPGFFTATARDGTNGVTIGSNSFLPTGKYTIRPALLLVPSGERLRGKAVAINLVRFLPD